MTTSISFNNLAASAGWLYEKCNSVLFINCFKRSKPETLSIMGSPVSLLGQSDKRLDAQDLFQGG